MNAIILTGEDVVIDEYITSLVKNEDIPPYNINRFEDGIKISDVREIIRKLSITSERKRLFMIRREIGIESQNALLKTLEELSPDVYIIFAVDSELLPTVVSRCKIVRLAVQEKRKVLDINNFIEGFMKKDVKKTIIALNSALAENSIEEVIKELRNNLLTNIAQYDAKTVSLIAAFLKEADRKYGLIKNNNLNSTLALESSILNVFEKF